jgi:hypothetical protein
MMEGHEIKALSAYMPFEVLENNDGARVEGVTVHEFLSIEAAKATGTPIGRSERTTGSKVGLFVERGLAAPEARMPQTKKQTDCRRGRCRVVSGAGAPATLGDSSTFAGRVRLDSTLRHMIS